MTNTAVIGIGSNDREEATRYILTAMERLAKVASVMESSGIYVTMSESKSHPNTSYHNLVAVLATTFNREDFIALTKDIETALGRDRKLKPDWIPVDIDVVTWNNDVLRPNEFNHRYFTQGYEKLEHHVEN